VELVDGLGYVALAVPDLDRSLDFYRRLGHLKVSERGAKRAFLTAGVNHHWLRLDETGMAGLTRISFQVTERAALDEVVKRLEARRTPWEEATDFGSDRVAEAIRFKDPGGIEIELFTDMVSLPVPAATSLKMDRVLHAVWTTPALTESHSFYGEVLGFKDSDWIERSMVFMRAANGYHHSIGIARSDQPTALDHFCILVDDLDDVLRARNVAMETGAKLRQELVRHAASGSVSTYIMDPMNDIALEFCSGHRRILDDSCRARILPATAATFNIWNDLPDLGDDVN